MLQYLEIKRHILVKRQRIVHPEVQLDEAHILQRNPSEEARLDVLPAPPGGLDPGDVLDEPGGLFRPEHPGHGDLAGQEDQQEDAPGLEVVEVPDHSRGVLGVRETPVEPLAGGFLMEKVNSYSLKFKSCRDKSPTLLVQPGGNAVKPEDVSATKKCQKKNPF